MYQPWLDFNLIYLIISIAICAGIVVLAAYLYCKNNQCKKQRFCISDKAFIRAIIIGAIVLFVIEALIVAEMFFVAGWDCGRIAFSTSIDSEYFSIYPNNLFLHGVVEKCATFLKSIGLVDWLINLAGMYFPQVLVKLNELSGQYSSVDAYAVNYVFMVGINLLCTVSTAVFVGLVCRKTIGNLTGLIAFSVSSIFIGLSPWINVPYSDTYSMFFITLIVYAYVCIQKSWVRWSIIAASTIIGFNIKPTVIFVLIGIVIVQICLAVKNYNHTKQVLVGYSKKFNKLLAPILAIVLTSVLCFSFVGICKDVSFKTDPNMNFTSWHFLGLGVNPDTRGFYNHYDVINSKSYKTVEEREAANKELIKKRINDLGFFGLAKLMMDKSMFNYCDGSFMWKQDSGPNFKMFQLRQNSFFDKLYDNLGPAYQIIWFAVLCGVVLACFCKKQPKIVLICVLTLLILSMFLMVFECGSRYLLLYRSLFVIVSVYGWYRVFGWFS